MNISLTILFYAKKAKTTLNGIVPIYLRVTIHGQRFEVSTKRYIEEKKWNQEAGRVHSCYRSPETKNLNLLIDALRNRVYDLQREIIQSGLELNIENFRNKWLGISDRPRMIIEIFRQHNAQLAERQTMGEYAKGTLDRYKTSLQHTVAFMKHRYNISDMDIRKLDYSFIADYEFWLKTVRRCNHNSTVKYLANFKKIIIDCRKKGWISADPFAGFSLAKKEKPREILTEEELQMISSKTFLIPRLNQVRDIFLFSCYTGLAYIEVKNLDATHISNGIDGNKWIFIQRQKTKKLSRIPLLDIPLAIIRKYMDHPACLRQNSLLPALSNQKTNSYLKEIADVCGIRKNLTFHIARHTFATVMLNHGVAIEAVSDMLGHSSLKQTQHYAKVKEKLISEEMQKIRLSLSGSTAHQLKSAIY